MPDTRQIRYLLVTHIPFARNADGGIVLDSLWARDLEGLCGGPWKLRVCGPELKTAEGMKTWGPSACTLPADGPITFTGFPPVARRVDAWKWPAIRSVLRREVAQADLVHTSNFFQPYVGLSYAHDLAVKLGKKTLFVIAEDFDDMLGWEFVRTGGTQREIQRRTKQLELLHDRVARTASNASLTFLHTPAAVLRYRLHTRNSIAIRQPGHETKDVISASAFESKCAYLRAGKPLVIIAACRHKWLKGLDFLIRAIGILRTRGIAVEARLYGSGEQGPELKSLTARLGLNAAISFPGSLPPGEAVYQAIGDGHIFAMPHRTTDFGRAFFDAMAGASPVIAFRTPASLETVRDGVDGLLASLDDVESLASAIGRLHQDRELLIRLSEAARERALNNTRSEWYRLRASWAADLFAGDPNV